MFSHFGGEPMLDVPLVRTRLKAAKRLLPRATPSVRQADSSPDNEPAVSNTADFPPLTRPEIPTTLIPDKPTRRSMRTRVLGTHGLVAILICMTQVAVQEAPAWGLSMVVHMVTLVTMAMVAVPDTVPCKAKHIIVAPPEEQQVEEVQDFSDRQPETLDENIGAEFVMIDAIDSNVGQDAFAYESGDQLQGTPAAVDMSPLRQNGAPQIDVMAIVRAYDNAYSDRGMSGKVQEVVREGGNEASEKCVANALKWLVNHQMPDGGWNFDLASCPSCRGQCRDAGKLAEARNAATGLALLPFLGSGYTHKDGKRYKSAINNGLTFLISRMQGGALNESGGNMYSHGIATIAICEAYALTKDRKLLLPAKAALNFVASSQDPKGGGWRYQPREKGDTSVLGWELMALKSGLMANLAIPRNFSRKATLFLDSVQSDGGALYGYQAPDTGSDATVAIGLLSRMYLGWKRDNPSLQRGVHWLSKRGPSAGNMYYNYYATQVMRHWEGDEWKIWNQQMRDQLIHSQAKQGHEEGSWFTGGGDMGAGPGGRLYCTAMAAMILEVYYRYMPIYRLQSIEQDFPE
jgi:hypothetical protein